MSKTEATMRRTGALLALTSASALVPFATVAESKHAMPMLVLFVIFLLGCTAPHSLEVLAAPAQRWVGFAFIMFYAAGNLGVEAAKEASVEGLVLFFVFLAGVWTVNLSLFTKRGSRPPAGPVVAPAAEEEDLDGVRDVKETKSDMVQ